MKVGRPSAAQPQSIPLIVLGGLRLDECTEDIQIAVHTVLRSSFSPAGYAKALGCCIVNGFLGELIDGRKVMNEHSYNFRLFGRPSMMGPWGYTFFGHHLCLAVVVQGTRMVIGPTFMGAEPDIVDEGPHAGLRLFKTERELSLKLMQNLSPDMRARATLSPSVLPAELPEGRWTAHDERHVGGAGHDNRVVPFGEFCLMLTIDRVAEYASEGCPVSLFDLHDQDKIVQLFRAFNEYYPDEVLRHRTQLFRDHLNETYFAWMGQCDDDAVYYFRIHSPVAFMEFDFHSGGEDITMGGICAFQSDLLTLRQYISRMRRLINVTFTPSTVCQIEETTAES